MVKSLFLVFSLTFLMSEASAVVNFNCRGHHNGDEVKIVGQFPGAFSLDEAQSTVFIGDKEISRFEVGQMSVSMFSGSFEGKNNHGDKIEGESTSMAKKEALVKIYSRGHGVDIRNLPMNCR